MATRFFQPSTALKFTLLGRWDEAVKTLNRLDPVIKEASLSAQMALGEQIVKVVKGHILNQDLPWLPLTEKYLERKNAVGADPRILIATQSYLNAIKVWKVGNRHLVMIGVPRGVHGTTIEGNSHPLEIAQIAAIHEFAGNDKLRRPLWNPTIKEFGYGKGLLARYKTLFVARARRRGISFSEKAFNRIF